MPAKPTSFVQEKIFLHGKNVSAKYSFLCKITPLAHFLFFNSQTGMKGWGNNSHLNEQVRRYLLLHCMYNLRLWMYGYLLIAHFLSSLKMTGLLGKEFPRFAKVVLLHESRTPLPISLPMVLCNSAKKKILLCQAKHTYTASTKPMLIAHEENVTPTAPK